MLVKPPLRIFNSILRIGVFPDTVQLVRVCPVFKTDHSYTISNYRAIGVLTNFAKIFESVLYKNILHITSATWICKRSTISNLRYFTKYVSCAVDAQEQVDVIYTDLSKAFDGNDHGLLLCKWKALISVIIF